MIKDEEFEKFCENLPLFVKKKLNCDTNIINLLEIILDLGRQPEARYTNEKKILSSQLVDWKDLNLIIKHINKFNNENRIGLENTFHRVSCIRNRRFLINGLTLRIGRLISGTLSLIRDLLESEKSILLLGKPGSGKTSLIREMSRILANEMQKHVIVIDTCNEIGGGSDIPHSSLGNVRRMHVSDNNLQYKVMLEAVKNHMPQVIIIDEISTELEVFSARTIAEKGIQLIATTHANNLYNLIKTPYISDLIGCIKPVTLSDDEARRRRTQKTVLERQATPTFSTIIEINNYQNWTIHENAQHSIDSLLNNNKQIFSQNRELILNKKLNVKSTNTKLNSKIVKSILFNSLKNAPSYNKFSGLTVEQVFMYPYCIPTNLLNEILNKINLPVTLTDNLSQASFVIGLKKNVYINKKLIKFTSEQFIPVFTLRQMNIYQFIKLIRFILQ